MQPRNSYSKRPKRTFLFQNNLIKFRKWSTSECAEEIVLLNGKQNNNLDISQSESDSDSECDKAIEDHSARIPKDKVFDFWMAQDRFRRFFNCIKTGFNFDFQRRCDKRETCLIMKSYVLYNVQQFLSPSKTDSDFKGIVLQEKILFLYIVGPDGIFYFEWRDLCAHFLSKTFKLSFILQKSVLCNTTVDLLRFRERSKVKFSFRTFKTFASKH